MVFRASIPKFHYLVVLCSHGTVTILIPRPCNSDVAMQSISPFECEAKCHPSAPEWLHSAVYTRSLRAQHSREINPSSASWRLCTVRGVIMCTSNDDRVQCAPNIWRSIFSYKLTRDTDNSHVRARYGCLPLDPSLTKVLPSNLVYCSRYRVISKV